MVDQGGSRKHKWSSPPEMSPSKYLRGPDWKLPRGVPCSEDSDSSPRARQVLLYSYESTPKRAPDVGVGSVDRGSGEVRRRRTTSLDCCRPDRQGPSSPVARTSVSLTEGDRRSERDDDDKSKSEELPRSRARRPHAPSLLFKKAFSDILGASPRERRPLDSQATSPPEAGRTPRPPQRESQGSRPSPRTAVPEEEDGEEKSSRSSKNADRPFRLRRTVTREAPKPEATEDKLEARKEKARKGSPERKMAGQESSQRSGSADHVSQIRMTITRPEEEPEVGKKEVEAPVNASRLVFLYESDKESDTGEKDSSIGSDFSDVEDMGTLTRFSQEDAPLPSHSTPGVRSPPYAPRPSQTYRRSWGCPADRWPTSPGYKPSEEQNRWRSDVLNKSCASEVSLSRDTSSGSEDDTGRERSQCFDQWWTPDGKTKRALEPLPAVAPSTPKFLQDGFIDTHCHLDMLFARLQHKRSFADLRRQYASTFPSEFQGCITDYCDPRTLRRLPWRQVLSEDLVWGAFGCHPHFAQYYTDRLQEEMMQAMRHPKAIAYGEMGLDYSYKCSTTVPDQHAVFEKQLKLAVPLGKPLVIHCRNADEDLYRIMKKWVPPDYKIHRHCFTGDYKDIEPLLSEFPNMSVGFTAVLTYPSAASARETVSRIPLDRLIIETDAPFFVPRQVSKSLCKFSHPGLALHTVQEVARLKHLPVKSVMSKVRENTLRLYNI